MPLPSVNVAFQNGNIGRSLGTPDGVFGLIASGVAIGSVADGTPFKIKSLQGLIDLGVVNDINNHALFAAVDDFYKEAGDGTHLWVVVTTGKMETFFAAPASALVNATNGEISGVFAAYDGAVAADVTPAVTLPLAIAAAQSFATGRAAVNQPVFVVIDNYALAISATDLKTLNSNRVGVMSGRTGTDTTGTSTQAVGLLAGRLAKTPVHRNIGRVKDGALTTIAAFIGAVAVESAMSQVEDLNDNAHISLRTHLGKSGYFFSDDPLATTATDDYRFLSLRRTIDKAHRVAAQTLTNYILDELPLNGDGTLSAIYAKSLEGHIEREIATQMTAAGELSGDPQDPNDNGVVAIIDTTNNVAADSVINTIIRVRPFGQARFFEVSIGFDINVNI